MAISRYSLKGFPIGYNKKTYISLPVIYKIVNGVSNKAYVGSTINLKNRLKHHRASLIRGTHSSSHLQKSFCKYGIDNFYLEVLEIVEIEDCHEKEIYWINKLRSYDRDFGYNMVVDSSMPFYGPRSDKHKKAISESLKGRKLSMEHCKNISYGRKGINVGKNNPVSKAVIQYSKEFVKLNEYSSITEASLQCGIGRTSINNALTKLSKTAGGYVWKYKIIDI